jgi:hypothetical protein
VPLTADQGALLGLLLERGQSYADIGGLLGVSEDEVRARARAALGELGGADPDRSVGLTDYLLGQADPIGRADAVRHLRDDADDYRLAERIVDELSEIAPGAELPKLPGEPRTAPHLRAARRRPKAPAGERSPRTSLSLRQTRVIVALLSGAVILAVVIAAIAGAFSGGGSSSSTTASVPSSTTSPSTTTTPGGGSTTTTPANPGGSPQTLTPVTLNGVGGSPGKGVATFGLATANTPFLDVRTVGVPPAPTGQVYSLWLAVDPAKRQAYPIAPLVQSHNRFPIPQVILPTLPSMKSVDIVISSASALRKEIKGVLGAKKPKLILREPGNVALRGAIPKKVRG